jgi:hypothetical protein
LTKISQKKKTENVLKFTLDNKHISQVLCPKKGKKNVNEKRKKKGLLLWTNSPRGPDAQESKTMKLATEIINY